MYRNLLWTALAATLLLGANVASADDDPPGRVGRLSYIDGTASFHGADDSQWSPATLNYPVFAGASFWTEPGSRVELQVGSTEIRLDESTELEIAALDDHATTLWLSQGVLNLRLAAMPPGGVRVLTPRSEITLMEPGAYHVDAGASDGDVPPTWLSVTTLDGRAVVSGARSPVEVRSGENAVINGDPMAVTISEGRPTPFDDWALERERREVARDTQRYVSTEATGYQDLDNYGDWGRDPGYGAVWYPRDVPPDWAPYRYGHWAFIPPWSWTWVDDAPWGFASSHYGRWAEIRGRWAWCPGEREARPVYAPALVAFIGGDGFGVTIAAGATQPAVGWVPLAPGETFYPHYRTSPDYVRSVNRRQVPPGINVTVAANVTVNNFANRRAATVVPSGAFTHAAPVQRATVAVPHEELAAAHTGHDLGHLHPSAAARAGAVVPAAAAVFVPRPNAPASLAKSPVTPAALPTLNEPAPPKAPGPRGHELRQTHVPPATIQQQTPAQQNSVGQPVRLPPQGPPVTNQQTPTQHGPVQQQPPTVGQPVHQPPSVTTTQQPPPAQHPPAQQQLQPQSPTGAAGPPAQTTIAPPPHDAAVNHPAATVVTPPPPPPPPVVNHPAATAVTTPPPPPPPAAVTNRPAATAVTPPPPPHPPAVVASPPKPPVNQTGPAQHGPPPKDKDKDEHKPPGN